MVEKTEQKQRPVGRSTFSVEYYLRDIVKAIDRLTAAVEVLMVVIREKE